MTVFELIEVLCAMPQGAQVVLADPDARPGPGVYRLERAEVQRIELGWWESNGLALVDPWRDDGSMSGPHPGVLLGTLHETPQQAGIAGGMYELTDEEMMRRIRKLRRGE